MNILGVFDGQHDSGACVLKDGRLVSAVDEERLARVKLQGGFPYRSIKECLRIAGLREADIDIVVVGSILTPPLFARLFRSVQQKEANILMQEKTIFWVLSTFVKYVLKATVVSPESWLGRLQVPLVKQVVRRDLPSGLRDKPIFLVNHHLSHAASAFYGSGQRTALAVVSDCWGDGLSFSVYSCKDTSIKRVYVIHAMDSFGHFYASVTKFLGFKPFRHEGKVLGLAAHGDPGKVDIPFPFVCRKGRPRFLPKKRLDLDPQLARRLARYRREDVAAWLQENMCTWIVSIVGQFVQTTGHKHVVLAGGVFSNVRFNQSVLAIKGVQSVYIFPNMGDAGLAAGGALQIANAATRQTQLRLEDVYLGSSYTDKEIEEELRKAKLPYKKHARVEKEIARLLANGHVVARFNGRMEYGPRALGNRSILYQATDPTVNDWLNKRLARTEFMPFAPATLIEDAHKCYNGIKGGEFAARFMTITFDCTDYMKKTSPAAVHVDGTARPQLVSQQENPCFYEIIKEYKRLTKIPSVINTSFNMHEEPIVCTPSDAIRAFLLGHLDYLAIGPFIVKNPAHGVSPRETESLKRAKTQTI